MTDGALEPKWPRTTTVNPGKGKGPRGGRGADHRTAAKAAVLAHLMSQWQNSPSERNSHQTSVRTVPQTPPRSGSDFPGPTLKYQTYIGKGDVSVLCSVLFVFFWLVAHSSQRDIGRQAIRSLCCFLQLSGYALSRLP